ncbi:MAG: succinylglutamate desuccinylase/aspartoacylase family protein [Eubacterium sp.]|nr:succinylglutamate desuccinylase/aspartoacylase family protein [Eubacterium sp.]
MKKEILFTMNTAFRGIYNIYGYYYGVGDKEACIVGAMRGNEYQQLYICSLLSQKLAMLEAQGQIVSGKSILIIPSLNYSAMNASHKFWLSDDTDINRVFPGNPQGTATSRIADAIFSIAKEYRYGIQFPSFYLQGRYIPHVRMMHTGHESTNLANLFGLPYVITGDVRSYDTTTLNYNWQMAGTDAFSIYSGGTERINQHDAEIAVSSVLRFLSRMGIIHYNCQGGYMPTVMQEEEMLNIKADDGGFFHQIVGTNEEVHRGQKLGDIIDPMDGRVLSEVTAPTDGIIFFVQEQPTIYQNVVIYKMIKKLHL